MTGTSPRTLMVDVMRRLDSSGLNRGSSGNISVRQRDGFLVTPSGVPPALLKPSRMVAVGLDGIWRDGANPSSEWRFHCNIYRERDDAGAIVHVHSPYATALSCLRRDIPAFHYMVAVAGGNSIRCARYSTFGTQALSDRAVAALEGRRACLLANHGMIALGAGLEEALRMAIEVESLAEQYCHALQVGEPTILGRAEMSRVIKKFATYGKPPSD